MMYFENLNVGDEVFVRNMMYRNRNGVVIKKTSRTIKVKFFEEINGQDVKREMTFNISNGLERTSNVLKYSLVMVK